MGTVNANFLPATDGLTLGNPTQLWTAYLQNVFTSTFQSNSPNPALSGVIRLASGDAIAWRNAANSADDSLFTLGAASGLLPADVLRYDGGGIQGIFISANIPPAASGAVRLCTTDFIAFRNNADGADVIGLSHNADDTVTVGDFPGIKQATIISNTANPALTGMLQLAQGDQIMWRNAANSGDEGIFIDSSDRFQIAAAAGTFLASSNLWFGGTTAGFPKLTRSGAQLKARLGDESGDAAFSCGDLTVNSLAGVPLVGARLAGVVALDELIGVSNLSRTIYTTPSIGQYRFTWDSKVTAAAGVSSTIGPMVVTYTDQDGSVISVTCPATITAGTFATTSTGNTTGTVLLGVPILMNCKAATTISYTYGYASNPASTMNFNMHIVLEKLT